MTETRSVRVRVSATLSGLGEFAKGSAAVKKFADDTDRLKQANLDLERSQIKVSQAQKAYDQALTGSDVDKQRMALNKLNRANLDVERSTKRVVEAQREMERSSDSSLKRFADDLDHTNERMSGVVQTSLALGPALVPVLATAAPLAAAAATGMTALAGAAGTAVLAFSGVGEGLKALNEYQMDPTAENLEKMRAALHELGPAGAEFTRYLQSLRPDLDGLQSIARQGMFPGLEDGIEQVRSQLPIIQDIIGNTAQALGHLADEGGQALSGPFWTDFLKFVRDMSGPALEGMGEGIGNIAEGLAGLTMAFGPTSADLGGALLDLSEAFAKWGKNVGHTQGFQEFITYLRGVGPEVGDTLIAVGNALVKVAEAAAPIGSVSLKAIELLANALGAIASIPVVGPALIGAAAGIAAISRAVSLYKAAGLSSMVTGLRGIDSEGKKASAAMTALSRGGLVFTGVLIGMEAIQNIGKSLDETLPGLNELQNRLQGLSSGQVQNLGPQFDDLGAAINRIANPEWIRNGKLASEPLVDMFGSMFGDPDDVRQYKAELNSLDSALAGIANSQGPLAAREAFTEMAKAQGLTAKQSRQLVSLLPQYQDAMAGLGQGGHIAAEGLSAAEQAMLGLSRQMAQLTGSLDRRSAMRAYKESVDAVNAAVKENGKTLNANTQAGRANADVLDTIARNGAALADQLHGLAKVRALQQTRKDFIQAAVQMGRTKEQARDLADNIHLVSQHGRIQIFLRAQGLDKTTQGLNKAKEAADRIPKRIDARVQGNTGDANRDLGVIATKMEDIDRETAKPKVQAEDKATPLISAINRLINALNGKTAKPSVNLQDNASPKIRGIDSALGGLDNHNASPAVTAQDSATPTLNGVDTLLNILNGKTATTYVRTVHTGGGSAEGNIFQSYAAGDVRNQHQPELAGAGPTRIWREPETGGESYIPHANDHRRGRAIDIWERTGHILGVQFARFAEGGMTDAERKALERERALTSGLRQFKVQDTRSEMRSELHDLTRTLRDAFGKDSDVLKAFGKLDDRLLTNARQAEHLAKVHERLTDEMHNLQSQRRSLEQSVASNFMDPEAFGGSMADLSLYLRANRNDAQADEHALRVLGRRGASDAFLKELSQSGNTELAQELAHASNRELRAIYAQFASSRSAARSVGDLAGAQVLGDEMKRTTHQMRQNNHAINHNTRQMRRLGRTLEKRVNRRANGAHGRKRGG